MESNIQLGFLEKPEDPIIFEPQYFPSKVGGKPSWIEPRSIPGNDRLKCNNCKYPMLFLLQFYAPLSIKESTHHRMFYVFCCRRGTCLKLYNSYKVFRCQLPQINDYYESDTNEEDDNVDIDEKQDFEAQLKSEKFLNRLRDFPSLCKLCGVNGPHLCSACRKVYYCSKEHQIVHWKQLGHSKECKDFAKMDIEDKLVSDHSNIVQSNLIPKLKSYFIQKNYNLESNPIAFDEWEIVTEEESILLEKMKERDDKKIQSLLDQYNKTISDPKVKKDIEESQIDESIMKEQDKQFIKFQERIRADPEQILRYTTDPNEEPLWISSNNINPEVPKCQYCGSERIFELQILPQLIYYLKVSERKIDILSDDRGYTPIEWGNLIIYSCKNSCDPEKDENGKIQYYKEEFLHQQFEEK